METKMETEVKQEDQNLEDATTKNSIKPKEPKANPVGVLLHLGLIVFVVHGYLQYSMYSSETGNWLWALASLLLPIINLYWVFMGLICYWEIHWAMAFVITLGALGMFMPGKKGYIASAFCLIMFAICTYFTFPERQSEEKIEAELRNAFNESDVMIFQERGNSQKVKAMLTYRIKFFKKLRVKVLRLGYKNLAEKVENRLKIEKETLNACR